MTNPDYTHILAIVDRSGSMFSCEADMRGGLDAFFKSQAELPGTCLVDYVQFDTVHEKVFEDRPVSLAKAVLQPRGGTALLDAIGKSVTELGEKLAATAEDDRPGKVLVVIVTDGYENSSVDWSYDSVKAVVEKQTNEFAWDFVFLGANIDAVKVGGMFGVQADKSITFNTNKTGETMTSLSTYATTYRTAGAAAAAFTDEDRSNVL